MFCISVSIQSPFFCLLIPLNVRLSFSSFLRLISASVHLFLSDFAWFSCWLSHFTSFFLPITVTVPTAIVNLYEVGLACQLQATAIGPLRVVALYILLKARTHTHAHTVYTTFQSRAELAQSESRLSVEQGLFPVKLACVLPEPLGSCGGIALGCWVGAQQGNRRKVRVCERAK